jgi:hypothetical protein
VSAPSFLFVLTFAFVCYVLGATFVEGLVNYRSWRQVGPKEFMAYHRAIGPRAFAIVVAPFVISVGLTALLFWFRPSPIPLWSIWLSLGADGLAIIVSAPFKFQFSSNLTVAGPRLPCWIALSKGMIEKAARRFNSVPGHHVFNHLQASLSFPGSQKVTIQLTIPRSTAAGQPGRLLFAQPPSLTSAQSLAAVTRASGRSGVVPRDSAAERERPGAEGRH